MERVTLWQHVQHGALAGIKKKKAQTGKNKDRCFFLFLHHRFVRVRSCRSSCLATNQARQETCCSVEKKAKGDQKVKFTFHITLLCRTPEDGSLAAATSERAIAEAAPFLTFNVFHVKHPPPEKFPAPPAAAPFAPLSAPQSGQRAAVPAYFIFGSPLQLWRLHCRQWQQHDGALLAARRVHETHFLLRKTVRLAGSRRGPATPHRSGTFFVRRR